MVKRLLYPAVFMLAMFIMAPAFGWDLGGIYTQEYGPPYADGKIYESDGVTLAQTGAFVQFVIGLNGAAIVDPLSFFDVNTNGVIDDGAEKAAVQAWVNAGADPGAISGGTNALLTATDWNGTTTLESPGLVNVDPYGRIGNPNPYHITNGMGLDKISWRAWNLTPEQMELWCTEPGVELWYTDGRELGWCEYGDTGWTLPADLPNFVEFYGTIGSEVANNIDFPENADLYRDQDRLDHFLGKCGEEPVIPEPGMMLLIGGAALLALLRKKK
jgi:hypothetical protein